MEKKITIGSKEFNMKSSAWTSFKYQDETGRTLITDLTELAKKYETTKVDEENVLDNFEGLNNFLNTVLRIAYIMAKEGKSINGNFEEFLMQIDNYLDNTNWISEVVELAISPFSRGIQAN